MPDTPPTEASEEELFERRASEEARAELVSRYGRLADRLAHRYRGRGESIDDLRQVALMGLVRAIDRFDSDRGVKFSTYATATILGDLRRHLRDKAWSVRVPRSLQEKWIEASRASADLAQRLGRAPSIGEVAHAMGASVEDVLEAMDAGTAFTSGSLDEPVGDEHGPTTVGALVASVDQTLERASDRVSVAASIKRLPERERLILYLRFYEGQTQSEIAAQLGISQMHVSRLLRGSLAQLRSSMSEVSDD